MGFRALGLGLLKISGSGFGVLGLGSLQREGFMVSGFLGCGSLWVRDLGFVGSRPRGLASGSRFGSKPKISSKPKNLNPKPQTLILANSAFPLTPYAGDLMPSQGILND